ncbi:MAG: hypothetical protein BECKG1743D_GA0114223_100557 [Candidatus Kentron sp. G]|nr:MAG: hypothetical protein BECKG1743F_GA0114225_100527 [Candidatus Kentron sp. G]VFM96399.1 MAG: hypothetical protein BECKG1743E_GA0114224_100566 [Candidatus Kentron sp. G]VFM98315.1 MAG: hypothetical protein BECKG1743D_GA0114223_100557 [Candidatus Kentron sp. G]
MDAIFLSAGVPVPGRGDYYKSADPFLIRYAVRELVVAVIRDWKIVWGGHPAITPMILAICQDLAIDYSNAVVLYQSRFFEDRFPQENKHFGNIVLVDAVPGDREASLLRMRERMLSRQDLRAGVFIGGMEGIEAEYALFTRFHPQAKALPVAAPGGGALHLAERLDGYDEHGSYRVDFARLFRTELGLPAPPSITNTSGNYDK